MPPRLRRPVVGGDVEVRGGPGPVVADALEQHADRLARRLRQGAEVGRHRRGAELAAEPGGPELALLVEAVGGDVHAHLVDDRPVAARPGGGRGAAGEGLGDLAVGQARGRGEDAELLVGLVEVEVDARAPVRRALDAQVGVALRRHQRRELVVVAAARRQPVAGHRLPEVDPAVVALGGEVEERGHPADLGRHGTDRRAITTGPPRRRRCGR